MDNTVYREVSFNDNFDCVADYNGEPIYLKKVEGDQQEFLLNFCHWIGKKGYKINGYDDGQLLTIIDQFKTEHQL